MGEGALLRVSTGRKGPPGTDVHMQCQVFLAGALGFREQPGGNRNVVKGYSGNVEDVLLAAVGNCLPGGIDSILRGGWPFQYIEYGAGSRDRQTGGARRRAKSQAL